MNLLKIKFSLCIVLFFLCFKNFSQNWENIFHFQSSNTIVLSKIVNDELNNSYIAGYFLDSYASYTSYGARDLFVAKINSVNKNIVWFKQIGGKNIDNFIDIAYKNNVIYFVGGLSDTAYIGNSDTLLMSPVYRDIGLIKFDKDGNCILKKKIAFNNINHVQPNSIIVDNDNNLIIVGNYVNEVNFESLKFTQSGTHNFILKLNNNGEFIWAKNIVGNNANTRLINVLEYYDGYYFNGYFRNQLYLDIDTLNNNSTLYSDVFLYKTDYSGNGLWVRRSYGNNNNVSGTLTNDAYGNIYFSGYYRSSQLEFDSTEFKKISNPIINQGNNDIFIVKYNKNGILQWLKSYGSSKPEYAVNIRQNYDLLYLSGYYTGQLIFGIDTLIGNSPNDTNMFIGTFDLQGNMIKGSHLKGSDSRQDISDAIHVEKTSVFLTGYFKSENLYVGESTLVNNNPSYFDGVLARYTPPYSAVFTSINTPSCYGKNDGYLKVTPYFGVPPYKYTWSHSPHPGIRDSIATGLISGYYSVKVTDSRDSVAVVSIFLNQPQPLNITASITNVSCYNYSNGAIDITVTGGTKTTDYIYNWTSPDGSGLHPLQADQTGLNRGTYYLTVKDDNLCSVSDTFIVSQPNPISFNGTIVTNVVNPPGGNGAVNLAVSGGTAPYSYGWAGPSGYSSSSEDISNLNGGLYYITVTDSRSCQSDSSFVVNDANLLIGQLTAKTDVSCFGYDDGTATITVYNATLPLSFAWSDGATFNNIYDTIHLRTALKPGLNTVTVTDAAAKTTVVNLQIYQPASALSVVLIPYNLRCNGDNSGAVDCIVSGGTLPFQYSWNTGYTGEDLVNVASGTYIINVTDARGCLQNNNTVVTQPQAISLTVDQTGTINCFGLQTGAATANASGGTGTFSYLWNDPGAQITKTATNLFAGNYQVRVTDESGCYRTGSILIQQPAAITINETINPPKCYNGTDGSILASVSGGTPPFFYNWSNGVSGLGIVGISNLSAGNYSLSLTDLYNCTASDSFIVPQPDSLYIISVTPTNLSCYGSADGSIQITAGGGTGQLSYSTNNGSSYQTGNEFTDLDAGFYQVLVRDANNCTTSPENVTLTQPAAINIVTQEAIDISCHGANDGTITIIASGGAGGFEYSIDGGATYSTNGLFTGLSPAAFQVRVRDAMNCEVAGNNLSVGEPDILIIDTTSVEHITDGTQAGSITLSSSGGTPPVTFVLLPDSALSTSGIFSALDTGLYKARAVDNNNCRSNELNIRIVSFSSGKLIIYDAFSPFTTPGKNDTWTIENISNYPDCSVKIFNAWGNQVFSSKGYTEPWDGTYNSKKLPAGTYYYVIDPGDGSDIITGTVNIVY